MAEAFAEEKTTKTKKEKALVIVESPAKSKTIKKILGDSYTIEASFGHVRNLPDNVLGFDVHDGFKPTYVIIPDKKKVVTKLNELAKRSDKIYLASDPDREGEAIAWHVRELLQVPDDKVFRIEFNEITPKAVKYAVEHYRQIDMDRVKAQQTRQILDKLVGYKLSPVLWKQMNNYHLSAGRVQSVALRMICEREEEIEAFVPKEYWSIHALMDKDGKTFEAEVSKLKGKKFDINNEEEASKIKEYLLNPSTEFKVDKVNKKDTKRKPTAPFITSTLQRAASTKLGFGVSKTMQVAQKLYEGIEIDGTPVGLITYMRTDSLRISEEAKAAAAEYIKNVYGNEYLPDKPRVFKSKNNAQDAHEAIRPSLPELTPARVKSSLTNDQYKLYDLIWSRFIASQMANALLDTVSADISANGCVFRASGYSVKFNGFTVLYEESADGKESAKKELPPLAVGDKPKLKAISGNQHFTQPPPRYTEASLIKALEENGIGRPSTYAPTISTITARQYVEHEGKQLKPTSLGEVITELMKEHFKGIVDAKFTADMESNLDEVEKGEKDWVATLSEFYSGFAIDLEKAETAMEGKRVKVPDEETDVICENCGKNMVIKYGRYGKFLACPGFPECRNAKQIVTESEGCCPRCGKKMLLKKSKRGRSFYGCEGYPECDFMTWNVPTAEKCPECGKSLFNKGGKSGKLICENVGCTYERDMKK